MGKNIVIVILAVVSLAAVGIAVQRSTSQSVLALEITASRAEKNDLAAELGKLQDQIGKLKSDFEELRAAGTVTPGATVSG